MASEMDKGMVCVTGASGFLGSSLIMHLLKHGYSVNATVRDPNNTSKVKHLLDLPNADSKLKLWKADLDDEGSFDEPAKNCVGFFHVATPIDLSGPQDELINTTVKGMLNVLRSCEKAKGTLRRVVFTSSITTICWEENRKNTYDEESWSDEDFYRTAKSTPLWGYIVAKTLAEKAAWEIVKDHNIDLISIHPSLIVGPFLTPSVPLSVQLALSQISGDASLYPILLEEKMPFVHPDDVCSAHIFVFEHPEAKGRYICSSQGITFTALAVMMRDRYPQYNVQIEFEEKELATSSVLAVSSKKLTDLGFTFRFSLEDMFDGAIKCCEDKGLMPSTN